MATQKIVPPSNPTGLVAVGDQLYGTTSQGGPKEGAIFSVSTSGKTHAEYDITRGYAPEAAMLYMNGVLYGTTSRGGSDLDGTIFGFDPASHQFTFSYSFGLSPNPAHPQASLIAHNGALFGTTTNGGSAGMGTVFEFTPGARSEHVVHDFQGGSDGATPMANLTAINGELYGTTEYGGCGNPSGGVIFKVDPSTNAENIVYAFDCSGGDAAGPSSGLLYAGGKLYGVTQNTGALYEFDPSTGKERVLHYFNGAPDGYIPLGDLAQVGGMIYGTSFAGGTTNGYGTVFRVDPRTGAEKVLHNFSGGSDGIGPFSGLIAVNGILYGTTAFGGVNGYGTVFKITTSGSESALFSF